MPSYKKSEAREWVKERLRGVANVVIPSYTQDLTGLNEKAIRHDIRLEIEYGFAGALMVSEVAITLDEYRQFFEWASDEAKGRLMLVHHASFNTLEENILAARIAEANGAELALLSYPANFYPTTAQEVFDYTKAFCDQTNLAVMLFPVRLWGFDRLHASDIEVGLIRRMLDEMPNIAAIKAEGGLPGINGFVECHQLFGGEVVMSCPLEKDMIPLAQLVPIQYSGTSNTEYYGATIPQIFGHLQSGDFEAANRLYWQINPARKANAAASAYMPYTFFIHRMQWKYQGWLNGFNGGPMRQPVMRMNDGHMASLRAGLVNSGLTPTASPDKDYFVGRIV